MQEKKEAGNVPQKSTKENHGVADTVKNAHATGDGALPKEDETIAPVSNTPLSDEVQKDADQY